MRLTPLLLISLSVLACTSPTKTGNLEQITYAPAALNALPTRDLSHERPETKSYLSLDLPYAAFEKIRQQVEQNHKLTLKNRGEAHITVVTPPEYKKIQKKVSMKEIYDLAEKMKLKESPYRLLCVGKGSLKNSPGKEETYYVVVESERLFELRQEIHRLFISRGGDTADFSPETFYPHVTLGFTQRDLHFEDGVTKDASSCIYSLRPDETSKN